MLEEDLRERWIEPDTAEYANTKERRSHQSLRHWFNKDTQTYYYLIGEIVYKSFIKKEVQEMTPSGNVTRHVWTLFDIEEEPGSIEDILRGRRASFDVRHSLF
jgi:hypothetical protein